MSYHTHFAGCPDCGLFRNWERDRENMRTCPDLPMNQMPVIVKIGSPISINFALFCIALFLSGIWGMGLLFRAPGKYFVSMTLLSLMFIVPFLGIFYRKIEMSITKKTVRWESERWPFLAIRWQEPFASFKYIAVEETQPSLDGPELLHFRPDRLTLIRKGKYGRIESRLLHIMLYHPKNPAKFSISLACFGFSEIEKARDYLDSAHKLLGLPKAILKNGQIEEFEDLPGE